MLVHGPMCLTELWEVSQGYAVEEVVLLNELVSQIFYVGSIHLPISKYVGRHSLSTIVS